METWLEWAKGPFFWFALAFMILGLIRHVVLTSWELCRVYYRAGDKNIPYRQVARATWQWLLPIHKVKERISYGLTTIVFHVSIILTPVLLAGHIVMIQRGTGLWWPAIPNILADFLTVTAVLASFVLIVQRLVRSDARAVSKFSDYAIPFAIAVPFASGYLVMHPSLNPFSFDATLLIHVMSANIVMILFPVTKMSHCILTPLSQFVCEMAWHWAPDAGSRLAERLNKESKPI